MCILHAVYIHIYKAQTMTSAVAIVVELYCKAASSYANARSEGGGTVHARRTYRLTGD